MTSAPDGICKVLGVLADETRLRVLFALARGEHDVSGLWSSLGLKQPAVSHHLAVLRQAGLATDRREGKRVVYRLGPTIRVDGPGAIVIEQVGFRVTLRVSPASCENGESPSDPLEAAHRDVGVDSRQTTSV